MKSLNLVLSGGLIFVFLAACTVSTPEPTQQPNASSVPTLIPEATSTVELVIPTTAPTATMKPIVPKKTPPPAVEGMWWNDTVFYEIFVRSFKDSDGDGVGDLNGLIEKLDYLNDGDPTTTTDLGITGIWLMPITQSPSYHGYDVVDYYAVDREYGTQEDFKRLLEQAHQRGIRVIIDLVLNHTAVSHPWFGESDAGNPEYRDWYIWSDTAPGYLGPWGQQVWYPGKDGYYYAVFWNGMPDLNLQNPAVTAEIQNITRFWLEEMGVDGFRMDAIKHFVENGSVQENTADTHTWLQGFHTYYKSINPEALVVGEAWTETTQVVDYIGDEVDIAFEFDLAGAFMRSASGAFGNSVSDRLEIILSNYPKNQFGVFLTNHDQDRAMSLLRDVKKAKLAAVMLLTAPGVPFIYYGEEIGMTGAKPDEDIRRPMQWTGEDKKVGFSTQTPWRAVSSNYAEVNVATQSDDPDSLLSLYRTLIHLRNENTALLNGQTLLVETGSNNLYAVLRYDDQSAFLVLVNTIPEPLTADGYRLNLEFGPFKGTLQATSVLGIPDPAVPEINANGGFSSYLPFREIPGQSATIIRLVP